MLDDNDFTDLERKHRNWSGLKKGFWACLVIAGAVGAFLILRPDSKPAKSPSGSNPNQTQAKNSQNSKAASLGASTTAPPPATQATKPVSLPDAYTAKKDQVTTGSTTSYSVDDSQGNTYYIVQQPALATLNIPGFENKLTNTEKLTVPTGTATIGIYNAQLIASIRTPGDYTWILITTPELSNQAGLEALAKALK